MVWYHTNHIHTRTTYTRQVYADELVTVLVEYLWNEISRTFNQPPAVVSMMVSKS